MKILLSVVLLTYNHAPYIKNCIERVLEQKVNFPIEVIVAEDCSTDGTRRICEEYAEKYPEIIRLISSTSNVGAVENEQRAFLAARGKYIATCEGDDYWTDPMKLQKQVDFLESHPDYSVCFHRYRKQNGIDDIWESDGCDNLFPEGQADDSIEISMHQFMHQWCTQYLTMVFRKDCYDFDAYKRYQYFRDTHQIYHLMKNGKCRLFAFDGGIYRMTGYGIYSTKDSFRREQMTLNVDKELWTVNNDKGWKEMCAIVMQHMIDVFAPEKHLKVELLKYSWSVLLINGRVKKLLRNIICLL